MRIGLFIMEGEESLMMGVLYVTLKRRIIITGFFEQ